MHNSRLLSLLHPLSAWEMNHLIDFIHSPYFNKHKRVIQLADLLGEAHPDFEAASISKEQLSKQIFERDAQKDEREQAQAMSDLMTYLTRLVEKYFTVRHFLADDFAPNYHLLEALGETGLQKAWQRQYKRMSKQTTVVEIQDLHRQHVLETSRLQAAFRWGDRTGGKEVGPMIRSLDLYYLTTRLRYACAHLNRQKLLRDDSQLPGMEVVMALVDLMQEEKEELPVLGTYKRIFQLLQRPEDHDLFEQTRAYLIDTHHLLPSGILKEVYAYLMNFCIQQINQAKSRYRQILFDLYLWQWEKGILVEEGWLSPWDLKNMVSLALKMKKYSWADQFLAEVGPQLRPEFRDHAIAYNLAMLRYEQEKHPEALRLLRDQEFTDVFYQLGTKVLLIKIYYESHETEALLAFLDSFEAYLRRPRHLSAFQRDLYLKLVRYTRRLLRLYIKSTYQAVKKQQVQQVIMKIQAAKPIAQVEWLVQKCQELLTQV